jgi:hypothetical protein
MRSCNSAFKTGNPLIKNSGGFKACVIAVLLSPIAGGFVIHSQPCVGWSEWWQGRQSPFIG